MISTVHMVDQDDDMQENIARTCAKSSAKIINTFANHSSYKFAKKLSSMLARPHHDLQTRNCFDVLIDKQRYMQNTCVKGINKREEDAMMIILGKFLRDGSLIFPSNSRPLISHKM
jgi:hypothetical protein